MEAIIPLDQMTVAEKMRALERIWDDLLRSGEDVPSPAWHEDVLRAREERVRAGASQFSDWREAKVRIRQRTQ